VTSLSINGEAVPNDASKTYRITVNSFLSDGGDGFLVLKDGTDRVVGPADIDALADYLGAHDPPTPPPGGHCGGGALPGAAPWATIRHG
jgi:5'-nucleotidase